MDEAHELSEYELIQRSLKNDLTSFSELVNRHQKTLLNFLRSLDVKYQDVEDISQEVWIKLYDYRSRYQAKAKFTTFLYQVAKMLVIDQYRKRTRWQQMLDRFKKSQEHQLEQTQREALASSRQFIQVEELLDQLEQDEKQLLVLRFDEKLSYREIGELLEIPLGTVKSRLHQTMKKLKDQG